MNRRLYRLLWLHHRIQRWLTSLLTPAGLGLLGGLMVAGLIGIDVKRSLSYQLWTLAMALLTVAIAASRFSHRHLSSKQLRATRALPRFGTVGVPLRYRVSLKRAIHDSPASARRLYGLTLQEALGESFPTFTEVNSFLRQRYPRRQQRDAWLRLLAQQRRVFAPAIALPPLASELEVTAEITPLRRGVLQFEALSLTCPDPLGLVNRCITLQGERQSVIILPHRYRLPEIALPGARRHQGEGLAAAVGDSEEFRALRDYRPGDSPRKIHWKSWAKTGKPIIKEEQAEYAVRYGLILDTFVSAEASEGLQGSEAFEEAVAIAASFAYSVQTQESLLDLVFVADQAHCFTSGRGLDGTERLLALLAAVVPCQDRALGEALLPVVQRKLGQLSGCICVLLDWDRDRKTLIEQLQAAGVPVLGLIIAPPQGLREALDLSCLRDRTSRIQVLEVGNIQAGLWSL